MTLNGRLEKQTFAKDQSITSSAMTSSVTGTSSRDPAVVDLRFEKARNASGAAFAAFAFAARQGGTNAHQNKVLLILAALALAPDRVLAQTTTYNCSNYTQGATCIDSITAVPGTTQGGVSIVVHWIVIQGGAWGSYDFFQIRYALPGGPDTQVKLGGGAEESIT